MNTGIGDAINLAGSSRTSFNGAPMRPCWILRAERIGFARSLVATRIEPSRL